MNATHNIFSTKIHTRLTSFAIALLLVALTGCDAMDPNAEYEETVGVDMQDQSNAAFAKSSEIGTTSADPRPAPFIPTKSMIDGNWGEQASSQAQKDGNVSFATTSTANTKRGLQFSGRVSGATACSDFSGTFRVVASGSSKSHLLRVNLTSIEATRCATLTEESMIRGLRLAHSFTLDSKGTLHIGSRGGDLHLVPQRDYFLGPPVPVGGPDYESASAEDKEGQ